MPGRLRSDPDAARDAPRYRDPGAARLTIACRPRTVSPDERVAGLPPLRRATGGPPRIDGPGVVPPARRGHPAAPHRCSSRTTRSPPSPPTPGCRPGCPTRCRPAGRSPAWPGAVSPVPGRSSSTAPAPHRWAARRNWCSSPRSRAPASAAATPACPASTPATSSTGPVVGRRQGGRPARAAVGGPDHRRPRRLRRRGLRRLALAGHVADERRLAARRAARAASTCGTASIPTCRSAPRASTCCRGAERNPDGLAP